MLPRSAMAQAGICQARQVSTSSSSLIAPSSSEYAGTDPKVDEIGVAHGGVLTNRWKTLTPD